MASVTSTAFNRQSSDILQSVTHLVPPGHEKPFKQAFYTTAALFFFGLGTLAAVSVYYILEAFIKPLLWALLCGSFLFPFKYSLNSTLQSWLKGQMDTGRPLFAGAVLLPLSLFDSFSTKMGNFVIENWKAIVAIVCVLTVLYILYLVQLMYVVFLLFSYIWTCITSLWSFISWGLDVSAKYRLIMMTIVAGYFIVAMAFQPSTLIRILALPMWILLLVCVASVAGSLQVPVGVLLAVLIVIGALSEAKKQKREQLTRSLLERTGSLSALLSPTSSKHIRYSLTRKISSETLDEKSDEEENDETKNETDESESHESVEEIAPKKNVRTQSVVRPASTGNLRTLKRHHDKKRKRAESAIYFDLLLGAFALVLVFHYIWLTILIIFPLFYFGVKKLLSHDTIITFLDSSCRSWLGSDRAAFSNKMSSFVKARESVLMPGAIHEMIKLIVKGDKKFHAVAITTLPTVTSIIIILFICTGSAFLTLFLAVKVQQESFVIMQMTSDLIDDTVSKHPEYRSWLPDNETMDGLMGMLVDKVYVQGRSWISTMVNSSLSPNANVTLVEKQALKVWDRAYTTWFEHKNEKPPLLIQQSSSDLTQNSSGLFSGLIDLLNMNEVIELMKQNMSSLKSVGESIWKVLQSNISLATSLLTTILTIIMSGGSAIVNFIFSMAIFFTALFYLLVSSEHRYKPVDMFGATTIASSVQAAIGDVFGASLKMASFYGLYTWLNHTTMGANLVYIPSVLAALFGVIPVFSTYWSCFPAALEIWLLQGSLFRATILFVLQLMPAYFIGVDAAIYGEISAKGGGHPYITGLAVVGGVYCYGIEGAIIGPIVLCCLLVAINVFTKVAELPGDESPRQPPNVVKPQNLTSRHFPAHQAMRLIQVPE